MKKLLSSGLARKAMIFAFVIGMLSPSALAYYQTTPVVQGGSQFSGINSETSVLPINTGTNISTITSNFVAAIAPKVQSLLVNPDSYNPANGNATISFTLDTNANTTVWIKDANDVVIKTLLFDTNLNGGQLYTYTWNGKDSNNQTVATGNYKVTVVAYNTVDTDVQSYNFVVNSTLKQPAPIVSASVSPTSFNPSNGETAIVNYNLNTPANLSILVKSNGNTVKTLRTFSPAITGPGSYTWDGHDMNGQLVTNGTYTIEVYASNNVGSNTANASVTVTSPQPQTAPTLSNVNATPSSFDPNNQNTNIDFTVDKTATVSMTVQNSSTTVRNLASGSSFNAGSYFQQWNGRDNNGNIVANGTYTINVTASNSAGQNSMSTTVTVNAVGTGTNCSVVTSNYANPISFNPNNQDTQINFSMNRAASVTVEIKNNSTVIQTLASNQSLISGAQVYNWNGRNNSGNFVNQGTYTYQITASVSGCADNVSTGNVTVTDTNGGSGNYSNDWPSTDENLVTGLQIHNEIFNPNHGERAQVTFQLRDNAHLVVQVMDGNNNVVKTLRDNSNQSAGTYSDYWDGRNDNGSIVSDAVYQFRIMADNGSNTDTDRVSTEVNTNGVIIGLPSNQRCAGYKDVSVDSPFCKAIQLMSTQNIFNGYSDGTFRPYLAINRAETTKVVTLALGYNVQTGSYFGNLFLDTISNAWYSPYLKVALDNNIINGYPDGTFRPGNTINRVELLKIFLRANHVSSSCSSAPFLDTPINADTNWYIPFACYAKQNGLMNSGSVNYLHPDQPMTRGDVASLFYNFENKGLYSNLSYNNYNTNTVSSTNTCLSYNLNGTCKQYSTNSQNGYYVYQNGHYVWMSY